MASDTTTAQRVAQQSVPRIAQQPSGQVYNNTSPQSSIPGAPSRPPIPLPARVPSGKPKHWIEIRNLPESHPTQLYEPGAGWSQPLA